MLFHLKYITSLLIQICRNVNWPKKILIYQVINKKLTGTIAQCAPAQQFPCSDNH
uniref:Uncharacterized protein n=1 Tax=Arundo donax TaxID=35708 RepID=A0A0A9FSA4_ARUDO